LAQGVNWYVTEIKSKARLEEGARLRIKRLPGRVEHLVDDRRHAAGVSTCEFRVSSGTLQRHLFLAAFITLAPGDGVLAAIAFALKNAASTKRRSGGLLMLRCG
jgi:hypothetical protein